MFEHCGRRTDGRTDDGRRIHWYTISSPCEPNGLGELISIYTFASVCTKIVSSKLSRGLRCYASINRVLQMRFAVCIQFRIDITAPNVYWDEEIIYCSYVC